MVTLLKIFHQTERNYDSSVRAVAAEMLLTVRPSETTVRNIMLAAMGDQTQHELATFVLRKLVDLTKYNTELR